MKNNLFIIAKSGWKYIISTTFAFVVFLLLDLDLFSFLAALTLLFFLYVFRNPERELPFFQKHSFIAPVDGIVNSIKEVNDAEFTYKIEIEGTYKDVALLRIPMNCSVTSIELVKGTRVAKKSKLFPLLNENASICFVDDANNMAKIEHHLKESFLAINIELKEDTLYHQGSRYGVVMNGVTTIYLPKNAELNLEVGDKVFAAKTLIAYFS